MKDLCTWVQWVYIPLVLQFAISGEVYRKNWPYLADRRICFRLKDICFFFSLGYHFKPYMYIHSRMVGEDGLHLNDARSYKLFFPFL